MVLTNIDKYIHFGWQDKDWYVECEELFTELYGREQLGLITKVFAATSINSSLKSDD